MTPSAHPYPHGAFALAALRVWVFSLWTVKLLGTPLADMAWLPRSMLEPISFLSCLPATAWDVVLTPWFLDTARVSLVVLCIGSLLALPCFRTLGVATAVGLTFWQILTRSFQHNNHPELALLLVTYVVVLFPSGDRLTPIRRRPHEQSAYDAGIIVAAALLLLTYSASASYRIAHHPWATLHAQIAPALLVGHGFTQGVAWLAELTLSHPWVAQLINITSSITAVVELTAPLAIVSRFLRWPIVVFLVSFHLVIHFAMQVTFWESALVLPAVLLAVQAIEPEAGAVAT